MSKHRPVALVIDDEIQIRRFLRAGFELESFAVQEAATAAEGLRAATLKPIDLVIVDLGLPDMDGAEVVERLRSWSTVPIIVLSVRSSEDEKVRLLELGADDYVVKPFGMAELLARARAALRRQARGSTGEPIVRAGPLSIDLVAAQRDEWRASRFNCHRRNIAFFKCWLSTPGTLSRTSTCSRRYGASRTWMTRTTCASSFARSARRSRRTQPSRGSS